MAEVMDDTEAVFVTFRYFTGRETSAVLSESSYIPASTLWHREHGRLTRREVAAQKQYLTPSEEKAFTDYVLRMTERGYPVPVKLLRYLAWVIARRRSSIF
jgi:hypothetical protein